MKLLRLESNEKLLNFDNLLNDNLIIPPKSKIGLSSISWGKSKEEITIDSSNDYFKLEFVDDTTQHFVVTIPTNVTYSKTNITNFMADLESALNNGCITSIPKCVGLHIEVRETSQDSITIESYQNKAIQIFRDIGSSETDYINIGVQSTSDVYSKVSTTTIYDTALFGGEQSYFFNTDSGCGIFRVEINNLFANAGKKGFYIGLSKLEGKDMSGNFDFDVAGKINFGIEAHNLATNYKYIKTNAGTISTPTSYPIFPNINDVLELSCSAGRIEGKIYTTASPNGIEIFSEKYDNDLDKLFPIIAFKDPDDCAISKCRYTPFKEQKPELELEHLFSATNPPSQQNNPVTFNFTFPTQRFATFLGYDDNIVSSTGVNMNLRAPNKPNLFDQSEAYIIELQNLSIDSYDMSDSQRKRRFILNVIQNQRDKSEEDVLFQTDFPLMIDLNNASDIILKNIRMRVLDTYNKEVNIASSSNAVILIDSP